VGNAPLTVLGAPATEIEVMVMTGKALVDHWTWAAEKGVMNKNTAGGLRSACTQVLGVLENWESIDVKGLDVEAALTRFQNLKKKDFKPNVLEVYKRRFRQAHASYLAYLDDPGGWKPRSIDRSTGERNNAGDRQADSSRPARHEMPQAGLVEYPFPLREGQIARLILPRDLKVSEVKRLSAFMTTLAIDFDPTAEA
jgi:hypothetical protein